MNPVLKICKRCRFYHYKPDIARWHNCRIKRKEFPDGTVGLGHKITFAEDTLSGIQFGKMGKHKELPWDYYFTGEDFGIPQFCPYYLEQLIENQSFWNEEQP
jgi:hypothetical protein